MEAITREEIFLAKIIGETVPDIEPIVRKEMFLARIAGMDIPAIEPITREEMFLNAIASKEVIDLKPITRRELFLAKAMGADVDVPNPITRAEFYLSQMTGGNSGGTFDKYSWEGVFASIDKGTYATDYAIGDMIPLDLGSEGIINMQIAAFDTDDLADGSGKAPITWIAKELFGSAMAMNADATSTTDGWAGADVRVWLEDNIKPLIPESVKDRIKTVSKAQAHAIGSAALSEQTTNDDLWIPAFSELDSASGVYSALYPEDSARIKCEIQTGVAQRWWLRDAKSSTQYYFITNTGAASYSLPKNSFSICLCFCT